MTAPQLKSVTVTDFRSIRGNVTVPLDAPVVLIHGPNGAGKTSILSAIELALTGRVPSLARVDTDYVSHLVHKEATEARVSVAATGVDDGGDRREFVIRNGVLTGTPLLSPDAARFYSERCYLPQSTLGRLLEIYQHREHKKSDSPLTEFVKDLLGIDHLDALIDGLYDAGDVRRLRTTVPEYWDVRERIPSLEASLTKLTDDHGQLEAQLFALGARLRDKLIALAMSPELAVGPVEDLLRALQAQNEEERLQQLARSRRDLFAALEQAKVIEAASGHAERTGIEAQASQAQLALQEWRRGPGQALETVLVALAPRFPQLPTASATSPKQAHASAVHAVAVEFQRCTDILERDAADAAKLAAVDQDLERARARASVLDQQIAHHAAGAGKLAQALAGVLPHVNSEECPVCGRDFAETSTTHLHAHVASRISALNESAGRLEALSRERSEAARAIAGAERERGLLASRQLTPAVRDEMKTWRARLQEFRTTLGTLASDAMRGDALLMTSAAAERQLGELQSRDQSALTLRDWVTQYSVYFGQPAPQPGDTLRAVLERLLSVVATNEKLLIERQSLRRTALDDAEGFKRTRDLRDKNRAEAFGLQRQAEQLRASKERADSTVAQAKTLAKRAREARNVVVRRVFSDSLNLIWRDLFVRLAPEEPFVPAFALPETQGAVEARLETWYRSGAKGGDPRAMLSAGNLNTAALTLFLALHLSIEQPLRWLLIDDPFQSMDEVHIAQFAALLRTLSKQQARQIVIAVHERPLFEYLALELSPAFADDRLITIELGRTANGATTMTYEPLVWRVDPAIGSSAQAS